MRRSSKRFWILTCVLAALSAGAPLRAQSVAQPADSVAEFGLREGTTTARAVGALPWTLGGFVAGVTLGPIGAGLAYGLAASSSSALPADLQSSVSRKGSDYSLAFRQAYTRQLIGMRKRASVMGGVTGTVLMAVGAFVYLQQN